MIVEPDGARKEAEAEPETVAELDAVREEAKEDSEPKPEQPELSLGDMKNKLPEFRKMLQGMLAAKREYEIAASQPLPEGDKRSPDQAGEDEQWLAMAN